MTLRRQLQRRILCSSAFKDNHNSLIVLKNTVSIQDERSQISIKYRHFFSKSDTTSWFLSSDKKDTSSSVQASETTGNFDGSNRLRSRSFKKRNNENRESIQLFVKNNPNFQPNTKQLIRDLYEASKWQDDKYSVDTDFCRNVISNYYQHVIYYNSPTESMNTNNGIISDMKEEEQQILSHIQSPETIQMALSTLLKTRLHTINLSNHLRTLERVIGSSKQKINMNDALSFRLMEVHGKAGSIGRCLSLLDFRKRHRYPPRPKEFHYAVQSIISAALPLRTSYPRIKQKAQNNTNTKPINEEENSNDDLIKVENPTRWLDAILINMYQRNATLNDGIADKMLSCFASSGRSGRGLHWFYQTKHISTNSDSKDDEDGKKKVRLKFNSPPSSYKIPSSYLLPTNGDSNIKTLMLVPSQKQLDDELRKDKILEASILFAKSLVSGGVCGHSTPVQLSTHSYNVLIKCCVHRGAFCHAFDILQRMKQVHPNGTYVHPPDAITYNTLLASLARVGDVPFIRYLLTEMTASTSTTTPNNTTTFPLLNKYTSQAVCDAYLNTSDVHGAITQIQYLYKQYNILPPYTTHYKVLEFSLGVGDVYEAKRYVWFLQEVWKENTFVYKKIGKEELKHLFQYFGVELVEEDDFYVWNRFCEGNSESSIVYGK